MFRLISLGLLATACLASVVSIANADYICAPVGLHCGAGTFLAEDLYPARYGLDHKGIYLLHFCEKKKDRDILVPIRNSKVQGFTHDCKKVFEAEYAKSIRQAKYLWPNGKPREIITYNDEGSAHSAFFDESGSKIRFSELPIKYVEKKPTAVIDVNASKKDRNAGLIAREGSVHVCSVQPVADFDLKGLEDRFRKRHLLFAYEGITDRSAVLVSTPKYARTRDKASFYYFSIMLNACDAKDACTATVSAFRKTAPVSNGIIQIAQAINSDDEFTNSLVSIAAKSILQPIRWCDFVPNPQTILRDLHGLW
jgi:hypothetical protein